MSGCSLLQFIYHLFQFGFGLLNGTACELRIIRQLLGCPLHAVGDLIGQSLQVAKHI